MTSQPTLSQQCAFPKIAGIIPRACYKGAQQLPAAPHRTISAPKKGRNICNLELMMFKRQREDNSHVLPILRQEKRRTVSYPAEKPTFSILCLHAFARGRKLRSNDYLCKIKEYPFSITDLTDMQGSILGKKVPCFTFYFFIFLSFWLAEAKDNNGAGRMCWLCRFKRNLIKYLLHCKQ